MRLRQLWVATIGAFLIGCLPQTLWAESAPALSAEPSDWINSKPISAEAAKGKAVLLWFFEEQ